MTSPIGKSRHDQMEPAAGSPDERLGPDDELLVPDDELLVPDDERLVPDAGAREPGEGVPVPDDERTVPADDPDVVDDDPVILDDDRVVPGRYGGAAEGPSLSVRWPEIQALFVDDPRASVELAARLTRDSVEALIVSVRQRQHGLLSAWQETDADTENLRTTLRAYRAFWNRIDAFTRDT